MQPGHRAAGRPRVVVVGAGFGGIAAVRGLRHAPVDVVLVDRRNHHLFQPLLYQVASALLDPSEIAQPVRAVVRGVRNCEVRLADVTAVDLDARCVRTDAGVVPYDHLVMACGSVTEGFSVPGVEHAFGLKEIGDALALRNHLLEQVERAVWTADAAERRRLLGVTVVGGGPTGVECAGALVELFSLMLGKDFGGLRRDEVGITLVEAGDSLLAPFAPRLRRAARRTLERRGVQVRLDTTVREVTPAGLRLAGGDELAAATVIWTAGVRGAPAAALLGVPPTRSGRIPVDGHLRVPGHPEVQVIGDAAALRQDGAVLPMLAPVAIQEGAHVARTLAASVRGEDVAPFRYRDKGTMATIGRNAAVAQIGPVRLSGFPGWVVWLLVHLVQIIGFRNRLVVLVNWAWDYVFTDRPVRLITSPAPRPPSPPPTAETPRDGR